MPMVHGKQIQDNTVTKAKTTAELIAADGTRAFTGAQSMGGFKITSLGTPTLAADAATKAYVDGLAVPGGADTQVQFNDGGVFGGDSGMIYDKTNNRLGIVAPTLTRTPATTLNLFGTTTFQPILRIQQETTGAGGPFAQIDLRDAEADSLNIYVRGATVAGNFNGTLTKANAVSLEAASVADKFVITNTSTGGRMFLGANGTSTTFLVIDGSSNVVIGTNGETAGGAVTATAQLELRGLAGTPALIVNENGLDSDTRIESDGNTHAFFLEANHALLGATGAIGLFTSTPLSGFDPQTSLGVKRTTVADADYTVLDTDYLVAYTSIAAARTVNLPTAVGRAGRMVEVKDESGSASVVNTITVDPSAAQTIDGAATYVISTARGRVRFYSDGANWHVVTT